MDLEEALKTLETTETIERKCKSCGETFSLSPADQLRHKMMGFPQHVRCITCRDKRFIKKHLGIDIDTLYKEQNENSKDPTDQLLSAIANYIKQN